MKLPFWFDKFTGNTSILKKQEEYIIDINDKARSSPVSVCYDYPKKGDSGIIGLYLDHRLICLSALPLELVKGVKLNRQVEFGTPDAFYYPFMDRDAWRAAQRLVMLPGIAQVGICYSALRIVTTRRYRERQITLPDLIGSIVQTITDYSGRPVMLVKSKHLGCDGCRRCNHSP